MHLDLQHISIKRLHEKVLKKVRVLTVIRKESLDSKCQHLDNEQLRE